MEHSLLALRPFSDTSISRLQSLYSDVSRQKFSNTHSYQTNITWWRTALQELVWSGLQPQNGRVATSNRLTLNAGVELVDALKLPEVGKPSAIGHIITELTLLRHLFPLKSFLSAKEPIHDNGWLGVHLTNFVVGKPLWWALGALGLVDEEVEDTRQWWGDYVVISLVVRAASAVQERQRKKPKAGPSGSLYTFEGFRKEFSPCLSLQPDFLMSETDGKVLVRYLERDAGVTVVENEIIKFLDDVDKGNREITPVDRGMLELKTAVEVTHLMVDSIQHKMDEHMQKATLAIRAKRQQVALSHLKLKKQLEGLLVKRLASLETLEDTLVRVDAAAGDIAILKSYKSSAVTLQMILSHPSLQREKIDETMEALAAANEDARDVNQAIREGAATLHGADFVEEDVEEELDALVRELQVDEKKQREEEESKLKERLERLQTPPTGPIEKEATKIPSVQNQEPSDSTAIATLEGSSREAVQIAGMGT